MYPWESAKSKNTIDGMTIQSEKTKEEANIIQFFHIAITFCVCINGGRRKHWYSL